MRLSEQAAVLNRLIRRTEMVSFDGEPGRTAEETWVRLTAEQVADLETIRQTLTVFEAWGADRYVRDRIARRRF